MTRHGRIEKVDAIALGRQCVLAGVARATLYARQKAKLLVGVGVQGDDLLKRLIDEEYTRHRFFGSRYPHHQFSGTCRSPCASPLELTV